MEYTAPMCSPWRAARTGIWENIANFFVFLLSTITNDGFERGYGILITSEPVFVPFKPLQLEIYLWYRAGNSFLIAKALQLIYLPYACLCHVQVHASEQEMMFIIQTSFADQSYLSEQNPTYSINQCSPPPHQNVTLNLNSPYVEKSKANTPNMDKTDPVWPFNKYLSYPGASCDICLHGIFLSKKNDARVCCNERVTWVITLIVRICCNRAGRKELGEKRSPCWFSFINSSDICKACLPDNCLDRAFRSRKSCSGSNGNLGHAAAQYVSGTDGQKFSSLYLLMSPCN